MNEISSIGNLQEIENIWHVDLDVAASRLSLTPEKLFERLRKDKKQLEGIDISTQQIVDKLRLLISKAEQLYAQRDLTDTGMHGRGCIAFLENEAFKISGISFGIIGRVPCPINATSACGYGRKRYEIENLETNETLAISEIQVHLIVAHGWFGIGKERIDPIKASRVLKLSPEEDNSKALLVQNIWLCVNRYGSVSTEDKEKLAKRARSIITVDDCFTAYTIPSAATSEVTHLEVIQETQCHFDGTIEIDGAQLDSDDINICSSKRLRFERVVKYIASLDKSDRITWH